MRLQVQYTEIIVQQPCPPPNGTFFLADHHLLQRDHILDTGDMYTSTVLGLLITCIIFFALTMFVFLVNCQSLLRKKNPRHGKRV